MEDSKAKPKDLPSDAKVRSFFEHRVCELTIFVFEQVTVKVVDPNSRTIDNSVESNPESCFTVTFYPLTDGLHTISVTVDEITSKQTVTVPVRKPHNSAQCDHQMKEKDALIKEKDGQIKERDGQIKDKDGQIKDRDGQIKERDGQIKDRDGQLKEKDAQIKDKDAQIKSLLEQVISSYVLFFLTVLQLAMLKQESQQTK